MTKSLVASAVESNLGSNLPVAFGSSLSDVGESAFSLSPYAVFASNRSPNFALWSQAIPGLNDGDPILIAGNKPPIKLDPFRFYLVEAFQHFSVVDSQGNLVRTSLDPEAATADRELKEHIETCILVIHGNELTPARCTFKTTKTNAAHTARLAVLEAGKPSWAQHSPEHKASLVCPVPWGRAIATVTLKRATSRSSGFAYVSANARVAPSGAADWTMLAAHLKDERFVRLCNDVKEQWAARNESIRSKAK